MLKSKDIGKSSGMSKLDDARKHCPAPIKGGPDQQTMQKVGKRGGKGGPYLNARSVQPKAAPGGKYQTTMTGKKK